MTTPSYSREAAKGPLHTVLHELEVVIPGLAVDGCHCNLIAEVALDALTPTLAALDRVRALVQRLRNDFDPASSLDAGTVWAEIEDALDGGA